MRNTWWAKTLRIVGIVFMSLTAAFTLLGGAGTTCVAFNPSGYDGKFAGIAPFQWLYIAYVFLTLAIGVLGVRAVVMLVKGTRSAYRDAIIVLVSGLVIGAIHIATSRLLRGGSMPVDMVVYVTVLTLVIFLLFKLPKIWQGVNFERPSGGDQIGRQAAAIALASTGILTLTIQFLMAPTHTIGRINYADVWHVTLTLTGVGLIMFSIVTAMKKPHAAPDVERLPLPALESQ